MPSNSNNAGRHSENDESDDRPKKKGKRGKFLGIGAERKLKETVGGKFMVDFDKKTWKAIGVNHSLWARYLSLHGKHHLPVQVEKYQNIDKEDKQPVWDAMEQKFHFEWNDALKESVNKHLGDLWKDWRSATLRAHFEDYAGPNYNKEAAKQHPHPDVPDKIDWEWLCDFWSAPEQIVKSEQNKLNRKKRADYLGSHGSKSYVAHRAAMPDKGPIEFHKAMHWKENRGWCAAQAETDYNEMVAMRNSQSLVEGDGSSQQGVLMHSEEDIVQKVRKPRPGYIKGLGRQIKSNANKSSTHDAELIAQLQQEVQEYKQRQMGYEKSLAQMTQFLSSQFTNFPNISANFQAPRPQPQDPTPLDDDESFGFF